MTYPNGGNCLRLQRRAALRDTLLDSAITGIANKSRRQVRREMSTRGKSTTLSAINERLAMSGRTLHPTKGFRTVSEKRSIASVLTQQIKEGARMPLPVLTLAMRKANKVAA